MIEDQKLLYFDIREYVGKRLALEKRVLEFQGELLVFRISPP